MTPRRPPAHPRLAAALQQIAAAERANSAGLPSSRLISPMLACPPKGPRMVRANEPGLADLLMDLAARPGGVTAIEAQASTGRSRDRCRGTLSALAGLGRLAKQSEGRTARYFKV